MKRQNTEDLEDSERTLYDANGGYISLYFVQADRLYTTKNEPSSYRPI